MQQEQCIFKHPAALVLALSALAVPTDDDQCALSCTYGSILR